MTLQRESTTEHCDAAVAATRLGTQSWAAVTLGERIDLLERLRPRIMAEAEEMVAHTQRAKGIDAHEAWASEDWLSGPWAFMQGVVGLLTTLRRVQRGEPPLGASKASQRSDGRTVVEVFPATKMDSFLLNGYRAEVWMRPGISAPEALGSAASMYRGRGFADPGVELVLGAGNVGAIAILDILYSLYFKGSVVVVKMSPVNDYLAPYLERIFVEFISRGWLRFVYGGAVIGHYLAHHPEIDSIHITGSSTTFNSIVWGTGPEADKRKRAGTPHLTKPITSELGGISPIIVAPGHWDDADLQFQAEQIVTSKLNNAGHNCIATQLLVLPQSWAQADALVDRIRAIVNALPARPSYYHGAEDRINAALASHPDAERLGADGLCTLVMDLDPHATQSLITEEVFAGVLGVVRLPGATTAEFLVSAVAFANDVLPGTLGASIFVDPATASRDRESVEKAVADLRYGSVGVNVWSALSFLLAYTPWGAFPGNTAADIGSGIGFVHNAFLLEGIEKTVVSMPFRPMHRAALKGHFHLSPKSPFFVTNRTGELTARRLTAYLATGRPTALVRIFASALRG